MHLGVCHRDREVEHLRTRCRLVGRGGPDLNTNPLCQRLEYLRQWDVFNCIAVGVRVALAGWATDILAREGETRYPPPWIIAEWAGAYFRGGACCPKRWRPDPTWMDPPSWDAPVLLPVSCEAARQSMLVDGVGGTLTMGEMAYIGQRRAWLHNMLLPVPPLRERPEMRDYSLALEAAYLRFREQRDAAAEAERATTGQSKEDYEAERARIRTGMLETAIARRDAYHARFASPTQRFQPAPGDAPSGSGDVPPPPARSSRVSFGRPRDAKGNRKPHRMAFDRQRWICLHDILSKPSEADDSDGDSVANNRGGSETADAVTQDDTQSVFSFADPGPSTSAKGGVPKKAPPVPTCMQVPVPKKAPPPRPIQLTPERDEFPRMLSRDAVTGRLPVLLPDGTQRPVIRVTRQACLDRGNEWRDEQVLACL